MWLDRLNQIRMTRRIEYFARKYGIKNVRKVALAMPFMQCRLGFSEEECFREACLKLAILEIEAIMIALEITGKF